MLKAIMWDFDGTICDTYPAIATAVNTTLAPFRISVPFERIIELASISLDICIRTLASDYSLPYSDIDAAFTRAYEKVQPIDQPPFPGITTLFQQSEERGIRHFIVTHRRRASLMVLLSTHTLAHHFTYCITADDGFPKKPAPDAFIHVLNTYAITPEQALVIGDRDVDILAGQAAGIPTCLFRGTFANIFPNRVIQEYHELADLLEQS